MLNILLYELNLLSKVDSDSLLLSSKVLGLSLQQMKDFLLLNNRLPTSEDVPNIFKAAFKQVVIQPT